MLDEGPRLKWRRRRLLLWQPTALAVVLAVALRATTVKSLAYPDEGGLILVARQWQGGGPGLYGHLWVDRPPLLLSFWRLADALGGVVAARVLVLVGVALLVVVAAWAGRLLGGRRGATWGPFVAAGLSCSPMLGTNEVNAELLAAPLVLLACAAILEAARPEAGPRAQAGWATLSGLAGMAAVLVKQNLADGLVFAVVLALVAGLTKAWSRARTLRVLGFGALGVVVPTAATLAWAAATPGVGVGTLAYSLYGFRAAAAEAVSSSDTSAPEQRLLALCGAALLSGLVLLFVAYVWSARRRLRAREPVTVALVVMVAFGALSIAAGASYWPHYLIELVPAAVLATGSLAATPPSRPLQIVLAVPVLSGVLAAAVLASSFISPRQDEASLVGWLADARRPGDTGLVAYGHANIVEASGLVPSSYPYLWSLPLRTHDPHVRRLTHVLSGPSRPTWVVEWISLDAWDLDRGGHLASALASHYRPVKQVCGVQVYLRDDVTRPLPPAPAAC